MTGLAITSVIRGLTPPPVVKWSRVSPVGVSHTAGYHPCGGAVKKTERVSVVPGARPSAGMDRSSSEACAVESPLASMKRQMLPEGVTVPQQETVAVSQTPVPGSGSGLLRNRESVVIKNVSGGHPVAPPVLVPRRTRPSRSLACSGDT